MSKARILVVVSLVVVAALILLTRRSMAAEAQPQAQPQVGQQAPQFTLPSQDGTPISLSDFKGKWVVLYFYPKDGTQGCTIEAHNFQKDQDKYTKENAVILGVSVQSTDSHKEFCAKENLTFRLLSDPDRKVVKAYGSTGMMGMATRNTFLIDPNGKVVKIWVGVDPSKHSGDVLSVLKQVDQSGNGL